MIRRRHGIRVCCLTKTALGDPLIDIQRRLCIYLDQQDGRCTNNLISPIGRVKGSCETLKKHRFVNRDVTDVLLEERANEVLDNWRGVMNGSKR